MKEECTNLIHAFAFDDSHEINFVPTRRVRGKLISVQPYKNMIMNGVYYKRLKLSAAVNQATDGQLIKKFGSSRERLELNFRGKMRLTTRVYTYWILRPIGSDVTVAILGKVRR